MRELLSILLSLMLSEASDCCPQWAEQVVRRAVCQMPAKQRERWEPRWLCDLSERPGKWSKLILSFEIAYSAWDMRERGAKKEGNAPLVSRFLLGLLRGSAVLFAVPVILLDTLAPFQASGFDSTLATWNLGAVMLALLAFKGGFVDWPWLRVSRGGAVIQLIVFFGAAVVWLLNTSPALRSSAGAFLAALVIWDLYWQVHRPLPVRKP